MRPEEQDWLPPIARCSLARMMRVPLPAPSRPCERSGGGSGRKERSPPRRLSLTRPQDLCAHPINFIVGGAESVAQQLRELHEQAPFDVANVEVRWAGLTHELVRDNLRRLMEDVMPILQHDKLGF